VLRKLSKPKDICAEQAPDLGPNSVLQRAPDSGAVWHQIQRHKVELPVEADFGIMLTANRSASTVTLVIEKPEKPSII
jgi:hypothetical protein